MKNFNQYITEKIKLSKDRFKQHNDFDFEIDIDSGSDAEAFLKGIEEVYGKTGIHVKDGKYQNVIFSGETNDDFVKVCGLIAVAWNNGDTGDDIMQYNGDEDNECDLAFYVPGYGDEIEANIDEIKKHANLWVKWFENNDFEYR